MHTFPCPIPKLADPWSAEWAQPGHSEIQFTTDGFAVITDLGLAQLKQYNNTYPSGVYAGKMWMRVEQDGTEYLCWWIDAPDHPDRCEFRQRKILHKRVIDLLLEDSQPDS